jgi:ferredoxin
MPYVVTSECIQCGACAAGCESNAITEEATQSVIDVAICIECGTCQTNCPVGAIIFMEEQEYAQMLARQEEVKAQSGAA